MSDAIFLWDIENQSSKDETEVTQFVNWLRKENSGRIIAIANLEKINKNIRKRLVDLDVELRDVYSTKPNSSDKALINEAFKIAMEESPPKLFYFITNNQDFAQTVSILQSKGHQTKVVIKNTKQEVAKALKDITEVLLYNTNYQCLYCNLYFKNVKDRNNHITNSHKKLNCPECEQKFALEEQLERHIIWHKKAKNNQIQTI